MSGEEIAGTIPKIQFPDVQEMSQKELLLFEKEILGMCFSGHILDSYKKHLMKLFPKPISYILNDEEIRDKTPVKVAGLITSRSVKKTKNDDNMAFIRITDSLGEIELIAFPKVYSRFSDMLFVDNVIFVNGTISLQSDENPKIIVNSVENVLQNADFEKAKSNNGGKLYLKVNSVSSQTVQEIISLLKEYSGPTEVVFYDSSTKKYVKASGVSISVTDNILSALKMILGPDSVVFKNQ